MGKMRGMHSRKDLGMSLVKMLVSIRVMDVKVPSQKKGPKRLGTSTLVPSI